MDIPDSLQKAADDERAQLSGLDGDDHAAQWQQWFKAAATIQAAITEHAKDTNKTARKPTGS
ncbi:hypothetical protein [Streptomyces sp. PSAA01]|uniref:hypothetical protein n=1 Tax=Streptomyces sp. PSAA01 TaxID=2912762 RepID=UPI001F314A7F|nr:hypothetical protein [Streptomyces sp. PSAA01]MCG0285208.1 hypothetical protein [Streptomyces sp. PSAA01]